MVKVTVQMPEELAGRIEPVRRWLPTILEFGLLGLRTIAIETASEIVEFLSANPTPEQVLNFQVSDRGQARLQRLLSLNQAVTIGESEQLELDELQKIEHIVVMLKAQLASQA